MMSIETRAAEAQGAQAAQEGVLDVVETNGVKMFNATTASLRCIIRVLGNLQHALTCAEPHMNVLNTDSLSLYVRDMFNILHRDGMLDEVREAVKDLRLRDELVELRTKVRCSFADVVRLVETSLNDSVLIGIAGGRVNDARFYTERFIDSILK